MSVSGWSSLAADVLLFNSNYNRNSFLNSVPHFLAIQSDLKLKKVHEKIAPKCEVLYFPVQFHRMPKRLVAQNNEILHLVWPHQWENDKNPQLITETLVELNKRQVPFRASIILEQHQMMPECFEGIKDKLGDKLVNFGFVNRADYLKCLLDADIAISTAGHEFYGVSM